MTGLFSAGGVTSPGALYSETLYSGTLGLFPSGSYQPNPLSDPESGGKGLATWWTTAWDRFRESIPPRDQLPSDAKLDKNWVDGKAKEIVQTLQGLEDATTAKDRRGYADLALQKLAEMQVELPLDALAAVPGRDGLRQTANSFRDASFTAAKAVVARTLNDARPTGENLRDTYRQLQLREAAATHYWIGGEPPQSIWCPRNASADTYLPLAVKDIDHVPNNAVVGFARLLDVDYETLKKNVDYWRNQPERDAQQEREFVAEENDFGKRIDAIANLTRTFQRQTADLAAKDPKGDELVQSAELAMVFAEAMRNVTGEVRDAAPGGPPHALMPSELSDRRMAGLERASELPDKFEERKKEEKEPAWAMSR
jgi:hypothetical protein